MNELIEVEGGAGGVGGAGGGETRRRKEPL